MPRKNLIRSDCFPYHVTGRSNNKEPFQLALNFVWEITTSELLLLTLTYQIEIHSFVLMPNHFHLLITVPKEDLGKVMNLFMVAVTKRVNALSGRSGRIFGGPYYWSIITSTRYYGHAFKYIYRNPVKARLCNQVEGYEFSTLHGLIGLSSLRFPITFTRVGMEINLPENEDLTGWLEWLNRPFPQEAEIQLQKALKKRQLRDPETRNIRHARDQLDQFL